MKALTLSGFVVFSLALLGCQKEEEKNPLAEDTLPPSDTKMQEPQTPSVPRTLLGGPVKDGDDVAVMETTAGKIVIRFFPDKAPETVKNFKKLAESKFYDGTKFHRTIPGFMIQGGDPNTKDKDPGTWGTGGPGWMIKDELNDVKHMPGILSMAHAGPNTGGSQFFIMVGAAPHLDRVHTAFGEVVEGMEVVDKIVTTPTSGGNGMVDPAMAKTITSLKIVKWPAKS